MGGVNITGLSTTVAGIFLIAKQYRKIFLVLTQAKQFACLGSTIKKTPFGVSFIVVKSYPLRELILKRMNVNLTLDFCLFFNLSTTLY